jgi:voltage-gated potassium channel
MDGSFRNRLVGGFLALMTVIAGGTIGYWSIGQYHGVEWQWFDCLYMTVITVTTVGYGETLPGMETVPYARGYTIALLVFGTGTLVYFASTITAFIVEGELKRVLAHRQLQRRIRKMKDHIVVCGAGTTGRSIIQELIKTETPVVAIDRNIDELREIAEKWPKASFTFLVGDATDDDVIVNANLPAARGLVAALAGDKDNLYLCVAARQANANLRIIARCSEISHVDKLKRAGADGVVSPNHIGAMRMVSEMIRPQVVRFLDDMMRDKRAAYRVEEVTIGSGCPLEGETIRDANIRGKFGMGVIACRGVKDDAWTYNPEPDHKLASGTILVVVGSAEQVGKLREFARG